jgi:hypothetical protein
MNTVTNTVHLPEPIVNAASRQAERSGLSLDDFVAQALAVHLGNIEATETFFRQRAAGAHKGALAEALRSMPDRDPDPEDLF